MPIATVAYAHAEGTQGVTTPQIDTTGANLIIYSVAYYNGLAPTLAFTDSAGNTGYALESNATGSDFKQLVYATFNPTTSATHTFTNGPTTATDIYQVLTVLALSGVKDINTDYESHSVAGSTVTSIQDASYTPSEDNCVAITVGSTRQSNTSSFACDYGATQNIVQGVNGVNCSAGMAWTIQTTATAYNPTWSWATASDAAIANLVFKAAAVAGRRFLLH